VWADWLAEKDDPRGELIALQRARAEGRSTPEGERREKALLAKHGKAWAGPLDALFEAEGRVFEDGFLAGGRLAGFGWGQRGPERELDDPALATIRWIDCAGYHAFRVGDVLAKLPRLAGLMNVNASVLKHGDPRHGLGALHVRITQDRAATIAAITSFPRLHTLGLDENELLLRELAAAPFAPRLRRVVVHGIPSAEIVASLAKLPALEAIELRDGWELVPDSFRFVVDRARGAADGWITGTSTLVGGKLVRILEALPAEIRSLRVVMSRGFSFKGEQLAAVQAAVARFTSLERADVPWAAAAGPRAAIERTGPRLWMRVEGDALLVPGKAWKTVSIVTRGLGLAFDSLRTSSTSPHRPLGKDPEAKVEKWAANKRCPELMLYQDGAKHELRLASRRWVGADAPTILEWQLGDGSGDAIARTFEELAELAQAGGGYVAMESLEVLALGPFGRISAGWLFAIGRQLGDLLPTDDVRALAIPGLTVTRRGRALVLRAGAGPAPIGKEACATLAAGLIAIARRRLDEKLGYDLGERFR
jgi:hypothetical protein